MTDASSTAQNNPSGPPTRLREALRRARIEAASKTGVVVDLRDAELARLEILNEALDPLFAEIPKEIDLFDRGISQGDPPRLWVDVIAHVQMGRDKRTYRLVQDTRYGRTLLAESADATTMSSAIADYIARRMIEREQALAGGASPPGKLKRPNARAGKFWSFVFGLMFGAGGLLVVVTIAAMRNY